MKQLWLVNSKIGVHRIPVSGTTWRQFCTVSTAWTAAVARVVVVTCWFPIGFLSLDVRVGWTLLCMFVGYGDIFSTKFQFWISIWTSTCEISGFRICWMSCWDMNTFFLESASAKVSRNKFPQNLRQIHGPSVLHPTCYSARLLQGGGGGGWTCKNKQLGLESREYCCSNFFLHMQHFQELKIVKTIFCFSPTIKGYQKGHDMSWCWGDLWVGDSQRCWWAAGNPRQHHQRPRRPHWSAEYGIMDALEVQTTIVWIGFCITTNYCIVLIRIYNQNNSRGPFF